MTKFCGGVESGKIQFQTIPFHQSMTLHLEFGAEFGVHPLIHTL